MLVLSCLMSCQPYRAITGGERQTEMQAGNPTNNYRQAGWRGDQQFQTSRQADRQTRQAGWQSDQQLQTDRQADRHTVTSRQAGRQKNRQAGRQRAREEGRGEGVGAVV